MKKLDVATKDKLDSLKALLQQGIISQEEFELNQKRILENVNSQNSVSPKQESHREDPQEILRKSLALGKISSREYKEYKKYLEQSEGLEDCGGIFSEDYHILRMRLAYGEIKINDYLSRMNEFLDEEKKARKIREKESKQKKKIEDKKKNTWTGKNVNLSLLVKEIEHFFQDKNFDVQIHNNPSESTYQIQASKKGAVNTITSSRKSLDVIIRGNSNDFTIGINAGEWGKNIAMAALIPYYGWTVGLAGIGMNIYFNKTLWNFIKSTIKKLENT